MNLICVKWGEYYPNEYVENLYQMAKRNCSSDFDFHVFSDVPTSDSRWTNHILPDWNLPQKQAWWYKMEIFNPKYGLNSRTLYIDLDTIIMSDIAPFWTVTTDFAICQDFNRIHIPNFKSPNSSVMSYDPEAMNDLYTHFISNRHQYITKFRGDQDYLKEFLPSYTLFPSEWVMSYRWEIWKGGLDHKREYRLQEDISLVPSSCKMVTFHGQPKPHTLDNDEEMYRMWKLSH